MPTPENPVQHKVSRAQALREFVREQTTRYEAGEIPVLSSREELKSQFGYIKLSHIDRDLRRKTRVSQRTKYLKGEVIQEIEDLRLGRIQRLSTLAELSRKFGYRHYASVRSTLVSTGLLQERRLAKKETIFILSPSTELAWIIGVVASGGTVGKREIRLSTEDTDLLNTFQSRGERAFRITAKAGTKYSTKEGMKTEKPAVKFSSAKLTEALGNLRRDKWSDTVWTKHRWVWEQNRYGWSFLEGFFEKRGGSELYRLLLYTSSRVSANFITEMMVRLGLKDPRIVRNTSNREEIEGVALYNLDDIKMFAAHIHPVSHEKAEILERFKDREPNRGRYVILYPDEQVIEEWIKARDLLKHPPTWPDISRLKREGDLMCSPKVFTRRFGAGSFIKARENLEKIIEKRKGRLRISPD